MASQENLDLARTLYDIYNRRDFDAGEAHIADDFEWLNVATGLTLRGRAGYREFVEGWAAAFPDSSLEITNMIGNGDDVVAEFTATGTHSGPLVGPGGAIPPTGRAVTLHFIESHSFANGRLRRSRTYFDTTSMMAQLGLLPDGSAERNKELVRRSLEDVVGARDLAIGNEVFAPDYRHHDPQLPPDMEYGREAYLAGLGAILDGFPDLRMTVHELLAEGDRVAARWSWSGTHTGDAFGIPATGRRVSAGAHSTHRIVDGKIAEGWVTFDALGMMQQLGVLDNAAATE
jgi:steroid delta-isomerase-like uncharacterized protein